MDTRTRAPILLIEDDQDLRDSMIELLEDEGFKVVGVPDGASALLWLQTPGNKASVIFLDLMMPRMNGHEFREKQLKDPALAKIPVVVLSADGRTQDKAGRLGADGFITKPLKLDVLLETAQRFSGAR